MASQATFLIVQFLDWVERRPRTRGDVQETWQSTCPLNSAWEDALAEDLVAFGPQGHVILTARGRAKLRNATAHPTGEEQSRGSKPSRTEAVERR
jgi:hypothetical protein